MKRSYTYLKGLLTLALAAFTGWMWAADPVATWTDFNTLTSGNYTITKDADCTVNADGSITLGGAGLSVALGAGQAIYDDNTITVVMDVSGVTNEGTLVSFTTGNEPIDLYYTGAKLRQRWATDAKKDTNYGNVDWTPARAAIVFAYDGRGSTGTTTYVDGTQKMNTAGLRFTGTGSVMSSLTFPATTGMTIHSIRLYSSKLSATDVANVSTALNANFISEFNGSNTIVVKGSDTAWGTAWDNTWGNNPTTFIKTPTGEGFDATGSAHPYMNSTNIPTSGDYSVALYANTVNVTNNAVVWWIGFNTWNNGNAISLVKTDADTMSVRHVTKTSNTVYAEYTSDELTKDAYRLYVVTVDNEADTTTINLYVDGVKTAGTVTTKFTPATGLQIAEATGNADRVGLSAANGLLVDNFYGWNKALTDAEVTALTSVMTPIPAPATYVRAINANADWSATDAWTLDGTSTIAAVPAEGKDAKITATADATLTVNVAANVDTFTTAGAGTLTIASDGTNTLTAQKTQIEANTIVNAGAASLGATSIAGGKTLTVKDMTTVSALSGTGVYNLDLGATTADNYTFAADGKNYKVSSGTFTNATLNFSATQTNYEFAGGELTFTGNEGQFSFGKANVKISGGTINATHLVTSQGQSYRPTVIEQTGGNIILSGTGNGSDTAMSAQTIMFGHWPSASSNYLLSGGSLVAENGGMRFGNDSASTMTISGGLLKVKGIKGKGTTNSALTITGGKMSLGDWGFNAIGLFTFTAEGGEINAYGDATINQALALNGDVTLSADASKTLTIYTITGSGTLTIAGEGTVALSEAVVKTIPVAVTEGATLKVIPTMDAVVLGKIVLAEGSAVNGTVTVEGVEKVTTDGATISFTPNATITGSTWWWDYEFNGSNASSGSDTGTMELEGNATSYTEADANGNQELYFQKTPYRGASFSSQNAFTAVMYCQPGNYNNVPLVGFGTLNGTAVILATGANAANGEMQILLNRGNSLTSLADNLIVPNATTAKHLYAFTYDVQADKTVISVYVDGKLKKVTTINERLYVSNGFQIGSVHGGVCTGLTKYPASGDAGTIDFLRVAKGVLSVETMTALAKAYPYVSEKGIAQRTIADAEATWIADAAWTQKVPNAADATQAAPNDGTNVELTATAETQVTVNLEADVSYESLEIAGSDVTLVAGEAAKKIVAGDVTIDANVTIPYGVAEIGTLTVNAGKTLTFDFSAYDFASVWADRTISLTGLATVADGAEVTATIPEPETLPTQIQSATLAYNGETQEYALVIDVVEGELTGTIAADGNWDSITWKMGEVDVTPTDFTAMTVVNLIASADATLSMNKAITVKNLVISGEGALIIAENAGNKLTVSGATTINANVTATAGAAALGSITINADNSLAIKEKINNVGTIVSNAGELVYMGGNITEDKQLTNVIGKIRIASGMVNFTKANGDYNSGAITIDNGATMKVSEGQHNSFGNSPITNNGAIVSAGSGAHLYPVVSGTGTLTVESGTLTLHGANTYQGGTTVASGTLVVSGTDAAAKVLPEGKTVTVNANATIQLVAGLSFVTIEGEGKTLVTGTYTYGIAGANGVASDLTTKTVEVAEGGVLQFRAWRAYALTIDTLIVNGTVKSEGYDGSVVPTVTVAQGQKLSGTGTIELAVTLADGALVGNAEVVPATAVVQGSVTCDTAEIATALAEKLTPPTGYRFNVTDNVLSIALNKVTVKLPPVDNAVWKDADDNTITSVTIDPNSSASVKLETTGDYVFADGSTSMDVTIESGDADSEAETPADASIVAAGAKIGNTPYASFADAFAVATEGDTITLLAGVTINSRLDIAQNVTIDLNGQTIAETMEDQFGAIYVKKGATLTIEATNGGEITTDGGIVIGNYGMVIVNGGTIAAGDEPEADVSIYNFYYQADWYGTTTINGGTVARIWNCGVATLAGGEVTDVDNSGAMEIAEEATVTNIILRDGTDAPGIEGAGTLTAPEGLTVTTEDGQKAVYADGKYTVVDIVYVAQIGEDTYETLADAIADAEADDTITLLANVATDVAIEVTKKVTIDLNGMTVATTQADTEGNGVFWVKSGGDLTLNGEGTINGVGGNIYNIAIWADGGKVTINGGTYTNEGAQDNGPDGAHFDLIYVKHGGSAIINGGTFKCQTPAWTLNSHDTKPGTIVVKGGTFKGFNPANCATEGPNTNWCVEDCIAVEDGEYYTVKADPAYGKVAKIGEVYYTTFADALAAAQAGDTITLLANVEASFAKAVTIDLNGNSLTGDVAATIVMNGGEYYAADGSYMAGPDGYYATTDATFVLGATAIEIAAGNVSITKEMNTLPGQTLTIATGASFTVPAGQTINVLNSTIIVNGKLTINGTVKLGGTYAGTTYTAGTITAADEDLAITAGVEGYEVKYADGKYSLVKSIVVPPAIAEDENIPAETKAAIKDAMADAGVAEITGYTITTKGTPNAAAEVADVADVLAVFEVTPTVEANGVLTVAYEFGISAMTNNGDTITITAGVTGAEYRAGVEVAFYADGEVIGTATTTADSTTVSITANAEAINGKKITVKAATK